MCSMVCELEVYNNVVFEGYFGCGIYVTVRTIRTTLFWSYYV